MPRATAEFPEAASRNIYVRGDTDAERLRRCSEAGTVRRAAPSRLTHARVAPPGVQDPPGQHVRALARCAAGLRMSGGKSDNKSKEDVTLSADELALAVMEDTRRRSDAVAGARGGSLPRRARMARAEKQTHVGAQNAACWRTWSAPGRVLGPTRCSWQAPYWARRKVRVAEAGRAASAAPQVTDTPACAANRREDAKNARQQRTPAAREARGDAAADAARGRGPEPQRRDDAPPPSRRRARSEEAEAEDATARRASKVENIRVDCNREQR